MVEVSNNEVNYQSKFYDDSKSTQSYQYNGANSIGFLFVDESSVYSKTYYVLE